MPVTALRTPDSRFENLPAWPYAPHYLTGFEGVEDLRLAYVDEGPADADRVFLCLHGEPTWGYLYRKMIPPFLDSGGRVVAPDFFGFGRSDKPVEDSDYTFHFHRNVLLAFIKRMDLKNITLVVQDWGGLLGLTVPHEMPERFDRLIVMNTGLGVGTKPTQGFLDWRDYVRSHPDIEVGRLMKRSVPGISDAEAAAYDAPFPDVRYKAGVRRFPDLVMIEPDMEGVDISKRAATFWNTEWSGESFMAIGAQDPVLGRQMMERLNDLIRGCPEPMVLENQGHFVQESGDEIAPAALRHFGDIS
jgi:pimeloyl-ACP methyl ester carboxylesterase